MVRRGFTPVCALVAGLSTQQIQEVDTWIRKRCWTNNFVKKIWFGFCRQHLRCLFVLCSFKCDTKITNIFLTHTRDEDQSPEKANQNGVSPSWNQSNKNILLDDIGILPTWCSFLGLYTIGMQRRTLEPIGEEQIRFWKNRDRNQHTTNEQQLYTELFSYTLLPMLSFLV